MSTTPREISARSLEKRNPAYAWQGAGFQGHTMKHTATRSLRAAINDKCRECIYDSIGGAGTWREQVTACTSRACPLYPVRPLTQPRRGTEKAVFSRLEQRSTPEQCQPTGEA